MDNNGNKNIVDKFLDAYESQNTKNVEYVRTFKRPSKVKSIFGFIVSLIFFVILIRLFTLQIVYFFLLIGDVLILIFYGINVFTKKGIGLPKMVVKENENIENDIINKDEE